MDGDDHSSIHPKHPPTTEDDKIARLRLLRSRRVGIATYHRLIAEHGTAQAALEALPDIAKANGVQKYSVCPLPLALGELESGRKQGARLVFHGDRFYPKSLATISDAPACLWMMGNPAALRRPMVALVGARNASSLGTRMTHKLAKDLAEVGITVVSGLARGVDTAAHLASLEKGTIAVMAGGVDMVYPSENTQLAQDILKSGLRMSEQPMGLTAQARDFPKRNRIISGLCRAVVVVEAAAKSGTLITARQALDQGRDVLAVPGHPIDSRAFGCNNLIRDGATLIRNADDILEALGLSKDSPELTPTSNSFITPRRVPRLMEMAERPAAIFKPKLQSIASLHKRILERLGTSPTAEDHLVRDLKSPPAAISPALTELEMDGQIERLSGGLIVKIDRN